MRRLLDILGALLGLTVLAPLVPFVAAAIAMESRGPVFVKLDRVSAGRTIKCYKFRSMYNGAHAMKGILTVLNERSDGPFFKIRKDPRVTKVGRVLRKFRIDEFPQLLNVLKGELSLVGPRPHEPGEVAFYPHPYKHLVLAKAGITGLSQVSGASGLPFKKELELDDYYIKHRNLALDAKILARTVKIIFSDPTAV